MRTSRKLTLRPLPTASAVLGLLLLGVGATPAYADSVRARQWHLDAMHAEEMWKVSRGHGITVAVIDSGVDDTLADLKGQVLEGKDYSSQRGDEHTDIDGHGTAIAALIAATGARGPVTGSYGLAPEAKILPIRMRYAVEDDGKDHKAEFSHILSKAIRYAADSQAEIINMSLGNSNTPGRQDVETPELMSAVKYALSKDKLLFAAVGNSGDKSNLLAYPAATPGVVGIGAADQNGKVAKFSQHGPQVDLVAPGTNMVHACPGATEICNSQGTSDATAIASASAALIWSKHPTWTNNQVLRVMLNTAVKPAGGEKRSDYVGYGGVRPRIALTNPGDPGPADTYPLPDLATASPSPKTSGSASSAGSGRNDSRSPAAAAKTSDDSSTSLWIGLGIAAAVVVGTAVAIPAVRAHRRRTRRSPAVTPTPPAHPPTYSPSPYQSSAPQAPSQPPHKPGQPG
ncbi:type VII secretion-associated serine protease mycosin [Streptomyces sp. NPDC001606]